MECCDAPLAPLDRNPPVAGCDNSQPPGSAEHAVWRRVEQVKARVKFLPAALNWLNVKETETEEELDVEAAVMTLHAYLAPLEKPRHLVHGAPTTVIPPSPL